MLLCKYIFFIGIKYKYLTKTTSINYMFEYNN